MERGMDFDYIAIDPCAGERPNEKSSSAVMIVMLINGINTSIHDMAQRPRSQRIFRMDANTIIITNFTSAVLYMSLNISIMICMIANATYNNVGDLLFAKAI
jgi:hypothetical protein